MIVLAVLLLLLPAIPLTGGRFSNLRHIRLRHPWVMPTTVLVQTVALYPLAPIPTAAAVLHAATYVAAGWWVWHNRHIRGLVMAGVGAAANFAAIAGNGGVMPAHPSAAASAGLPVTTDFANSAVATDTPLWFLGDIFAIPAGLPLANVFSIGDLILFGGAVIVLYHATRPDRGSDTPLTQPLTVAAVPVVTTGVKATPRRGYIGPSHRWTLNPTS